MEFLFGVIIGVIAMYVVTRRWQVGVLKVYVPDDGDSPYLFTELDKSIGYITQKRHVLFKVDVRNVSSHK